MAKPNKGMPLLSPWFKEYLITLVEASAKDSRNHHEDLSIHTLVEEIDALLTKHASFFEKEDKLKFFGSLEIKQVDTLSDDNVSPFNIAGKMIITGNSISFWVDPELAARGVLFGAQNSEPNSKAENKIHPELERNSNGSHILSKIINALPHIKINLEIPANIIPDGLFVIEWEDVSEGCFLPIQFQANLGAYSSSKIVLNYKQDDIKKRKSIIFQSNEFSVDENGEILIFRNQNASLSAAYFTDESLIQKKDSHAELFSWDSGGKIIDTNLSVKLPGIGAQSIITGIYNPIDGQKFYFDTEQIHSASNTVSDLLYKGVIGSDAYASWKGNIIVEPKTTGTNGYQANNNLIIADTAKVESIPGLEIETDDVRCSHGVTIGNIDGNHMFYLQSRGINKEDAEELIISGFIASAQKRIKNKKFQNIVSAYLSK